MLDFAAKNWKLTLGIAAISTMTSLAVKPPAIPVAPPPPPPPPSLTAECSCDVVLATLEMCLDLKADAPRTLPLLRGGHKKKETRDE